MVVLIASERKYLYGPTFLKDDWSGWSSWQNLDFGFYLLHEGALPADFNRTVSAICSPVMDRSYEGFPLHYQYQ